MAYVSIGSQETDSPQTPTLRQFAKRYPDRRPKVCTVALIFKPGKVPNYTLTTDTGFKVSVLEDNPLFNAVSANIQAWMDDSACLVIIPTNWEKGSFDVSVNTDELCEWVEKSWGYKLTVKEKQKTRTKK